MLPITKGQRFFYGVICAAALLVAILGLFSPEYLASIFTWMVLPPLHARFVGAIYLFGAVFMAGCLLAKTQAEVVWGNSNDRRMDWDVVYYFIVKSGCI